MGKLNGYFQKRNFNKSPEPKPASSTRVSVKKGKPRTKTLVQGKQPIPACRQARFVIQKHKARHLHYDFRLERDDVLKSWAIPKEPPAESNVKRLAIAVEDHPLDYAEFEGEIPAGLYGAGEVEIWDKGIYRPDKWETARITFELKGQKLKGIYCLLKLKPKLPEDKNWLFFKVNPVREHSKHLPVL